MDHPVPAGSQRALNAPPPTALAPRTIYNSPLADLWALYGAEPIRLKRTQDGRELSHVRYHRARRFMMLLSADAPADWTDFLYSAGIVVQLAISSHLLDVGFPDDWCARNIGLHVDRSLAYANVTGFGCDCDETTRLTQILAPYWKWNRRHLIGGVQPYDGGFKAEQVQALISALIDHVGDVTGNRHRPMAKT
ncbi:hypothetical protein FHS96_005749 [Sphingomonas zeicaulis]|uniref:hypothetical protein n=1 Tax=Sphingomonas zeicaulis TaxID=1632740 RepID=UPI003D1AF43E